MFKKKFNSKRHYVLFTIIGVLLIFFIVWLKISNDKVQNQRIKQEQKIQNTFIPDTSLSVDINIPIEKDTMIASNDSNIVTRDKRKPYEAGYEDSYYTGTVDGSHHKYKNTYDETSQFDSIQQKQYKLGYRKGYDVGFKDGESQKQFNIKK